MEVWKDIIGYEGFYKVSNYGNVKRLSGSPRCKEDRLLKIKTKKNGYKFVQISILSDYKCFHVHRLVAEAFIPKLEYKLYVNHKDMDKSNNHVSNLEWVTAKENNAHARLNKVFNVNNKKGIENPRTIQVCQKNLNGDVLYLWSSVYDVQKNYSVCATAISIACRKGTKSIGYFWSYIDKHFYSLNNHKYKEIPPPVVNNLRKRDLSKSHQSRINNLKLITNKMLIDVGIKCFYEYGVVSRKHYDILAKENKIFTYKPTVKRFGTWGNFKKEVLNVISKQTQPQI